MADANAPDAPGVLYYDPNPTTTKLAVAGLRLAGYRVFPVEDADEAVETVTRHGPAGEGSLRLVVLDASVSPDASAALLRRIVKVPKASELPGLLLVSRKNPTPIPGAESLPTLRRPFSTPALVRAVRQALADDTAIAGVGEEVASPLSRHLAHALEEAGVLVDHDVLDQVVRDVTRAQATLGMPAGLTADLATTPLESVLALVAELRRRGVVEVHSGEIRGRLHVDDANILHGELEGSNEDVKLGRFLVELGMMTEETLEPFVGEGQKLPLGLRLVRAGAISESDLAQALSAQAREITCILLSLSQGTVVFQPTEGLDPLAEAARANRAELRISDALLDGLRRRDDRAAMGPEMAGVDDVFVRIDENVVRLGRHAFTQEELAVLELLNGRHSVKEVARKTRAGTYNVARILYRLTRAHLARKRHPPVAI
ncbi:MAG: DUF4388 domain-containing protein [Deltaproteobacteria bacterium]|nr:MAG: DUF4388 domain-containing protein [Deltaproteobacteria bacterium]